MTPIQMRFTKLLSVSLLLWVSVGAAAMPRKAKPVKHWFRITMPSHLADITQSYLPPQRLHHSKPDFVLIQNIHSNILVQFAISDILKQLDLQGLLPQRIAIEGGVGLIPVGDIQRSPNARERRDTANRMVAKGEMMGAAHYVVAQGQGALFGVENNSFYQPSVEMFRRSYYARNALSKQLDELESAMRLLKTDPGEASRANILEQDIQVIRRLIDQQLLPTEIHQVMAQAVFAVEHLKHFVTGKKQRALLEPVSAAVNFYAFALLRDKGLFKHSEDLRRTDRQRTTVLIAGGFHTPGITRFLKEEGYSYVVITPQTKSYKPTDERLYVQRLLGYPLPIRNKEVNAPVITFPLNDGERKKAAQSWLLASEVRDKLSRTPFTMPQVRDIFTAMDQPLPQSIKLSLVKQRAEMLQAGAQTAANRKSNNANYLTR